MRTGNIIVTRNPRITAYEIAVANGFVGTEVEWLASLGNTPLYKAIQADVNTGAVDDKFVTPKTLKSSSQWGTKFNMPVGDNTQYLDGAGVPTIFPSVYTKNETDTLLINKLTDDIL